MKEYNEDTIIGNYLKNLELYPEKEFLKSLYDKEGRRTDEIHTYTWKETGNAVRDVCCGLLKLGFDEFDKLANFSPNRPRWIFSAASAIYLRGVGVPIYPTSKSEDVWWILHDSGTRYCICGSKEHLERVLEVKDRLPKLEKIIVMDPLEDKSDDLVMDFNDLVELGKNNHDLEAELEKRADRAEPEDLACLIYTSGTTGKPKGVMLSNKNFVSQRVMVSELGFRQDDIWMVHIPLCHSFGITADFLAGSFVPGILAILDSLEPESIRWGLQTYKPTVMNSVPRLWEKIYIQINTILRTRPQFIQNLFKKAIEVGKKVYMLETQNKEVPASLKFKYSMSQPVFAIVKKRAGLTRLRFCSTGGGPINPNLILFFGAMGIKLYQGFGLTETSPVIFANTIKENKIGTCGKAIGDITARIEEDGEILVKGSQVMQGYWNNPEANAEVFTEDGFFRTGDIGFLDEEGYLTITDRKKELLKTSGGKYVAPQPIENEFNTEIYVEQVAVVGDGRKYMTALVVPEFEALTEWANNKGITYHNNTELVNHPDVKNLIDESVAKINKNLAQYEKIKNYHIVDQPFSEEGGEITPTQKLKRRVIETKYKEQIDEMYPKEDIFVD